MIDFQLAAKKESRFLLGIEILAVALNLGYTILYIYNSIWCFPLALLGSALFVYLCYVKKILAESVLQLFYVGLAIYGWSNFYSQSTTEIFAGYTHIILLTIGTGSWITVSLLLKRFSPSKMPFIDSFTTVFSILATWLMVNFDPVNWYYWIIIDSVAIYLYAARGLYIGAVMFFIYLILAIVGLVSSLG